MMPYRRFNIVAAVLVFQQSLTSDLLADAGPNNHIEVVQIERPNLTATVEIEVPIDGRSVPVNVRFDRKLFELGAEPSRLVVLDVNRHEFFQAHVEEVFRILKSAAGEQILGINAPNEQNNRPKKRQKKAPLGDGPRKTPRFHFTIVRNPQSYATTSTYTDKYFSQEHPGRFQSERRTKLNRESLS